MARHVTVVDRQQNPWDDVREDWVIPDTEDQRQYSCPDLMEYLGEVEDRAADGEKVVKSKEEKTL